MSEPGAGSDLASLKTKAARDGDDFVVNGQKVWTSGAHDADVLLTFVRTDPDAPKHKGISVLLIPTDSPGVARRPFASASDREDRDFNEVFFTDVRVPAENLIGALNDGWRVASGSLGHERTMLWMGYADQLQELTDDFRPSGSLERDRTPRWPWIARRCDCSAPWRSRVPREVMRMSPSLSVLKFLAPRRFRARPSMC